MNNEPYLYIIMQKRLYAILLCYNNILCHLHDKIISLFCKTHTTIMFWARGGLYLTAHKKRLWFQSAVFCSAVATGYQETGSIAALYQPFLKQHSLNGSKTGLKNSLWSTTTSWQAGSIYEREVWRRTKTETRNEKQKRDSCIQTLKQPSLLHKKWIADTTNIHPQSSHVSIWFYGLFNAFFCGVFLKCWNVTVRWIRTMRRWKPNFTHHFQVFLPYTPLPQ